MGTSAIIALISAPILGTFLFRKHQKRTIEQDFKRISQQWSLLAEHLKLESNLNSITLSSNETPTLWGKINDFPITIRLEKFSSLTIEIAIRPTKAFKLYLSARSQINFDGNYQIHYSYFESKFEFESDYENLLTTELQNEIIKAFTVNMKGIVRLFPNTIKEKEILDSNQTSILKYTVPRTKILSDIERKSMLNKIHFLINFADTLEKEE